MSDKLIAIQFAGEALELLPERVVWWASKRTLFVADVHLGKGAAFRAAGVPVPSGGSVKTLARLGALLTSTSAARLIILGDFVHARAGLQPEVIAAIESWRQAHREVEVILVRGNHDRSSGRVAEAWNIREVEEPFEFEGFKLAHGPCDGPGVLCGHVHPVVSVRDFDGSSVRVPCFVLEEGSLMLPAFGAFTGGYVVSREEARRIYLAPGSGRVSLLRT